MQAVHQRERFRPRRTAHVRPGIHDEADVAASRLEVAGESWRVGQSAIPLHTNEAVPRHREVGWPSQIAPRADVTIFEQQDQDVAPAGRRHPTPCADVDRRRRCDDQALRVAKRRFRHSCVPPEGDRQMQARRGDGTGRRKCRRDRDPEDEAYEEREPHAPSTRRGRREVPRSTARAYICSGVGTGPGEFGCRLVLPYFRR